MRFMVIVKATAESEKEGALPDPQLMADMGKFNEELIKAGVVLAMDGLQPSCKGARVKFSGKSRTVVDGPFTETKEQLGGILILEADDLNHAIQLMSKHPGVRNGPFEIRPAADLTEMVHASEQRRSKTGK